jgi:hypothetical protein
MMSDEPVYHMHAGETGAGLEGKEQVKGLYRLWAETNQNIFYTEGEEVAVADHFVASYTTVYQQVWGRSLTMGKILSHLPHGIAERIMKHALHAKGLHADENAIYLYKTKIEMIWPYDDRGRLVGEDEWEPDPSRGEVTKLAPAEVLTSEEAARLLESLIEPLPSFDEAVLGRKVALG